MPNDREYNARYYKKNKKKISKNAKQYRDKNRKSINAKAKQKYNTRRGWDYELRRNYGITVEDYDRMFKEQNGRCKICGRHRTEQKFKLCVDYNHETGKVRGLLCHRCNVGLGFYENFREDLYDYLETTDGKK